MNIKCIDNFRAKKVAGAHQEEEIWKRFDKDRKTWQILWSSKSHQVRKDRTITGQPPSQAKSIPTIVSGFLVSLWLTLSQEVRIIFN